MAEDRDTIYRQALRISSLESKLENMDYETVLKLDEIEIVFSDLDIYESDTKDLQLRLNRIKSILGL